MIFIRILFAATLSIASTNDYVFTVLTSTNGIEGVGCGTKGDYRMMRIEDLAFLDEAWEERRQTSRLNFYYPAEITASTNKSSKMVTKLNWKRIDDSIIGLTGRENNGFILNDMQMSKLVVTNIAVDLTSAVTNNHLNFENGFNTSYGYSDIEFYARTNFIGTVEALKRRYEILKQAEYRHAVLHASTISNTTQQVRYWGEGHDYEPTTPVWRDYDNEHDYIEPLEIKQGFDPRIIESATLTYGNHTSSHLDPESMDSTLWSARKVVDGLNGIGCSIVFNHFTNQHFSVTYAALCFSVSCQKTIYVHGEVTRKISLASHYVLIPVGTEQITVEKDNIRLNVDMSNVLEISEALIGRTITPSKMKSELEGDLGDHPKDGGHYGIYNYADVETSIYLQKVFLEMRVRWHAREEEL